MKKIYIAISTFVLLTQVTFAQEQCLVVRGVVDIGSASTKVKVNLVDQCLQKIQTNLLPEISEKIDYKTDLKNNNNQFSEQIAIQGLAAIQKLVQKANETATIQTELQKQSQNAIQWQAIATSAFRTSKNGKEIAQQYAQTLQFKVNIIPQEDEAKYGFIAGSSIAKDPKKALVWDIGGGSQQLSFYDKGVLKTILLEKMGSVDIKNLVMQSVLKKDPTVEKTPNPIGYENYKQAQEALQKYLEKDDSKNVARHRQVIGIGGVHQSSIPKAVDKKDAYTLENIHWGVGHWINEDDAAINDKYADTFVTNLLLVESMMDQIDADKVTISMFNISDGFMLDPTNWTR